MSQLILPRVDKEGNSYISYSQVKSWNSAKGFNTSAPGNLEYIMSYFLGDSWPDSGFAGFGLEVEDYICEKKSAECFTDEEKAILDQIEPLGHFQQEVKLQFDNFYLLGYIDDATPDFKHIRDLKTCSEKSSKQYYEDDYYQLDIYSAWVKQEFGYYPDKIEVRMIERAGNAFRGGRPMLTVSGPGWSHLRETNDERQAYIRKYIEDTARDISAHYVAFLKLTGQEVPTRELVTV